MLRVIVVLVCVICVSLIFGYLINAFHVVGPTTPKWISEPAWLACSFVIAMIVLLAGASLLGLAYTWADEEAQRSGGM